MKEEGKKLEEGREGGKLCNRLYSGGVNERARFSWSYEYRVQEAVCAKLIGAGQ